jgi:hypothetical protein
MSLAKIEGKLGSRQEAIALTGRAIGIFEAMLRGPAGLSVESLEGRQLMTPLTSRGLRVS